MLAQQPSIEELPSWESTLTATAQVFLPKLAEIAQELIPIEIPSDLVGFLAVPPTQIRCFEYAFCQIKEARALNLEELNNEQIPGLLKSWGYTQVSFADAVPGDLVLYFNQTFPTHLGVYKGNGMVLSKWGNETPMAYLHHASMAPAVYGARMAFYRPPKSES